MAGEVQTSPAVFFVQTIALPGAVGRVPAR